jgi:hypothetical protein
MRRIAALLLCTAVLDCSSTPEPAPRFVRQETTHSGSIGAAAAAVAPGAPALRGLNTAEATMAWPGISVKRW